MVAVSRQLVLVFSSFILHFLSIGISQSFGVIYSELISVFEIGKGETAWVASLFTGLLLGTGKSFNPTKVSLRKMCILTLLSITNVGSNYHENMPI